MNMKYLFGPVNSRRLGRSLGVDLVPFKTCSLNCIYCESGGTTEITSDIAEYVPTEEVISELDQYLSLFPELDAITFSGSGEPTLHAGIGRIIAHLKEKYPKYKVTVLTNGTMLWAPEVRKSLRLADIVIPSLDAISPDVFIKIARPAPGITPERVIEGLIDFRKEYRGLIFLEVFIVPGINDGDEELAKLRLACLKIRPDKVQVNSLDRPGSEDWVEPADGALLLHVRDFFKPLDVDIIGTPAKKRAPDARPPANLKKSIISLLRRRPSTMEDLCAGLGTDAASVGQAVASMMTEGLIAVDRRDRGDFYRLP